MNYTIVQHSGYAYSGNPQFRKGLEPRAVSRAREAKVREVGGLIFASHGEAEDWAMEEQYRGVDGLIPNAPGTFSTSQIDGLRIYVPVPASQGG